MAGFLAAQRAEASPSVRDLQALAELAAKPRRRRKPGLSRAARLQLIDMLSRWTASGLAVIAGVVIYVAITAGRNYPLRATVWGVIVLGALYFCRRLQREFRAGGRSSARPFRWRSNYTAMLSVLGAAFGAGAVIALPAGAPAELVIQTLALLLCATLAAGVLHASHGRAAASICLPSTVFILLGAAREVGLENAIVWVGAASATGGGALFLFHRYLRQRASRRFPRTAFTRRELSDESDEQGYSSHEDRAVGA